MLALAHPSVVSVDMEVGDVVGCRSQGIGAWGSKLRAGEGAAGRPTHECFPVSRWRLASCHWRENRP